MKREKQDHARLVLGEPALQYRVDVFYSVALQRQQQQPRPSDAHDLVLEISLSPDFRYSGHTASTGAACTTPQVGNSGVISCIWAGATGPNGVRTLDVSAFSNVGNQNTVSVNTRSATQDPVPGNNAAAVSVTVGFLIEEIPSLNALGLLMLGLSMVLVGSIAARRLV